MNQLRGTMAIIWLEIRRNFTIFFTVLLSIVLMTTIFTMSGLFNAYININTNIPLLVYASILGAQLYRLTFQYGISFGVTRRNFYIGAVTSVILMAVVLSMIHNVIYFGVGELLQILSIDLTIFNLNGLYANETILNFLFLDFTLILFILSSSMIFSIVWYRYGLIPLYLTVAALFMTLLVPFTLKVWKKFFTLLLTGEHVLYFGWLAVISFALFIIAFPMIHTMDQYAKDKGAA